MRRSGSSRWGREDRGRRAGVDPDALEELVSSLVEASKEGTAIVVEGERDERSLRELGVTGPILRAARWPALEVAEEAALEYGNVIILTDWDRGGGGAGEEDGGSPSVGGGEGRPRYEGAAEADGPPRDKRRREPQRVRRAGEV